MSDHTSRVGGFASPLPAEAAWERFAPGTAYRCEAHVLAAQGRFTAIAAAPPGVTAEGATEKEALDNLALALAKAIAKRKANGEKALPEKTEPPTGAFVRYVVVQL